MKETIAKVNRAKRWFFEKLNKIDKLPETPTKKGRRLKSIKLEMKKEKLQQTTHKYNHKRLLWATIC